MTAQDMNEAFIAAGVSYADLFAAVIAAHKLAEAGRISLDAAADVVCKTVREFKPATWRDGITMNERGWRWVTGLGITAVVLSAIAGALQVWAWMLAH